jgi:hypothetical protein
LVIHVESADIMATLIHLKSDVESKSNVATKWTFTGASEAHLLARELAKADVGVVLIPARPFPSTWEQRRILPGPPLSADSGVSALLANNVTVGLGVQEQWAARNTRLDVAWAALESREDLDKAEALALATTNIELLLGLDVETEGAYADMVATRGGDLLDLEAKVVGVISPRRGLVELIA